MLKKRTLLLFGGGGSSGGGGGGGSGGGAGSGGAGKGPCPPCPFGHSSPPDGGCVGCNDQTPDGRLDCRFFTPIPIPQHGPPYN